jgi:hypothetical protein
MAFPLAKLGPICALWNGIRSSPSGLHFLSISHETLDRPCSGKNSRGNSRGQQQPTTSFCTTQLNRIADTDALGLALASGACYALAFTYEAGFASRYHFPLSLISLNLTTGLAAAAAGASALVLSATTLSILVGSLPRSIVPSGEAETRYFAWRLLIVLVSAAYCVASGVNLVLVVVLAMVLWVLQKGSPESVRRAPTVIGLIFERLNAVTLLTIDLLACLLLGAFVLAGCGKKGTDSSFRRSSMI